MEAFVNVDNFWDLPSHASTFSTLPEDDFLALLQKQFPTTNNIFDLAPPDGVDPLNINPLGIPNPTPPSTDSSPSPPSIAQEPAPSRPQSGVFSGDGQGTSDSGLDDPILKRKASSESMDDEPIHKNAHTSSDPANKRPASGPHRRKSTGNPHQDETRLLKRKEQNRAAQRAFRERKEKHVKDLEDKVAALEAKNQVATSENENLRDLLQRLQSENMALKQAAFTFSVPKPNAAAHSPMYPSPQQHLFSTPGASTSSSASPPSQALRQQSYDVNFASLIPFDPASLSVLDEPTATDSAMNMDYGFGQPNGMSPYKTIASNPLYMSFAEPQPYEMSPPMHAMLQAPSPADSNSSGMPSFSAWGSPSVSSPPARSALESLLGGYHGPQPTVDFSALLETAPSAVSPVAHAGARSSAASSAVNSPPAGSSATSPSSQSSMHPILPGGTDQCPRTKEEVSQMIQQQGASAFTVVGPNGGFVKKMSDGTGTIVMCKGSSFPKTEKSERNIEVLAAWRTITSNPQFKNVDINELCSEFTKKARCDGTKVVLEPEGVHDIMENLGKRQ
ncbi:hypothetical protein BDW22DRAFT_1406629 [Trametopsis cervina]|nr:hypothetical protein BDW22DRAFT_1406629 [Trametopsis cervina]